MAMAMDRDPVRGRFRRRTFMVAGVLAAAVAAVGSAAFALLARFRRAGANDGTSDLHAYDLGRLPAVDPALIRFERSATLATGFVGARDMAIAPDSGIRIALGRAIVALAADGSRQSEWPLASPAGCLAFDGRGRLLVGMRDHVEVHDDRGTRLASWPVIDGRPYLTCIASTGDDVFVADAGNRMILRYRDDGERVGTIGGALMAAEETRFVIPSPYFDVRVAGTDRIWVANTGNHRLESFAFDGSPRESWGMASLSIEGFCGCCNPCRFIVLPDGRFVTSEKGLPRVKIHAANGALESVVADPAALGVTSANFSCGVTASQFAPPIIASGGAGRIILLHPPTGDLIVFSPVSGHDGVSGDDQAS
ncbi:MAG: hypothetical protein CMJ18_13250 [Phycisphaeraceae bacterium]|nr:hypothetical protein [Phycisphaeraceae bacterium]